MLIFGYVNVKSNVNANIISDNVIINVICVT
jgi:hypothetical protein